MVDLDTDPILPIEPGFKFKCARCGQCCIDLNRFLTIDQLSFFRSHDLPVFYTITLKKSDRSVISIYPSKGPMTCLALKIDRNDDTTCLIYNQRPYVCKTFPFVMRIYYKRPPTREEMRDSLRIEDKGHLITNLKKYIHKLDNKRWVFFGYRHKEFCKGVGEGDPWLMAKIRYFIVNNIYLYENTKDLLQETNKIILSNLNLYTEERIMKYFEKVQELFTDDNIEVGLYQARNTDGSCCYGNLELKKSLSDNLETNEPLK